MIPDCVDSVTNPIVQDMLRRRDETIENLIEEIKETEKLKEHYKQKYDKIKSEKLKFNERIFIWWVFVWMLILYLLIDILRWYLI